MNSGPKAALGLRRRRAWTARVRPVGRSVDLVRIDDVIDRRRGISGLFIVGQSRPEWLVLSHLAALAGQVRQQMGVQDFSFGGLNAGVRQFFRQPSKRMEI